MRKIFISVIIVVLIISIFLFVSCSNKNESLNVGFELSNKDVIPSDYCAYKSDFTEFNINDVTLDFYYGGKFNSDIEVELERGKNISNVELYFKNDALNDQEPYFIKKTEDSYVSEKYRCKWITDKNHNLIEIEFNHHEKITIPENMFVGTSGKITFYIFGNNLREINNDGRIISGVDIHYKIDGNKVILQK